LFEASEARPAQSLQNQVRGPVAAPHAGANQSDTGDVEKIIGRFPLAALRLYERDRKHPVLAQGVFEHFLVTRFENVEGQKRMRKKQRAWERHYRDLTWQRDGLIHGE
jgi:hypothetical protein